MKRLKIMKAYAVLWLFIYFLVNTNLEAMSTFFFATLTFNLAVLTVLIIGIIVILKSAINLIMLAGTFGTLAYKKDNLTFYLQGIEKIMPANIAHMFHSRAEKGVLLFTSEESRAVVEWIDEKFSNQSRYVNYFIGTSLMIGLLGTFTGLLVSIDQMGKIILSLTGDIDLGEVIRSFSGPLGGMAIGFGSSLFGVIAAIILGLMGYILNKNQETLIEGVEDWLKGRIIDSPAMGGGIVSTTEELPQHKSSFLDVFIDNISLLTKEMAKISMTNERLHSITIASVQQARDEHEVTYEVLESINNNLTSIGKNSENTTNAVESGFSTIKELIIETQQQTVKNLKITLQTLSENITQTIQTASEKNDINNNETITALQSLNDKLQVQIQLLGDLQTLQTNKLEELVVELQNSASLLSKNNETQSEHLQEIITSILQLEKKIQKEMDILTSIEALQKSENTNVKKQNKMLESLDTTAERSISLEQKQLQLLNNLKQSIEAIKNDVSEQSQDNAIMLAQKLEAFKELLQQQEKNQELGLHTQNETKQLLQKHHEILEMLLGKNNESLQELKKISLKSFHNTTTTVEEKKENFFSKIFG